MISYTEYGDMNIRVCYKHIYVYCKLTGTLAQNVQI